MALNIQNENKASSSRKSLTIAALLFGVVGLAALTVNQTAPSSLALFQQTED